MCGIAGFVGFEDKALIKKMTSSMKHRGPDAEGFYTDKNIALGHRRLAIIDLDKRSNQPMSNENGTVWIVFNGEIYNFREIRPELEKAGHRFRTQSDTEVIIHAYEEWGTECLKRFNGMFAFAIADSKKKLVFAARDRMGVKPFYYWFDGKRFLFASEIKAILEADFVERQVDMEAFYHYLTYLNTPAPSTLFKGIKKLPAGHFLLLDARGVKIEKWWDLLDVKIDYSATEGYAVAKTGELLKDSVKKRMLSDVPHGVFLSGGLDSSAITAIMSEISSEPVNTFSISTGDSENFNELNYARMVAERFGTNHREFSMDLKSLMRFMPALIFHEDEPVSDPNNIPVQYLAEMARKNKVIVMQVGEGSDELFCGYASYGLEAKMLPLRNAISSLPLGKSIFSLGLSATGMRSKLGYLDAFEDTLSKPGVATRGILGFTERGKKEILSDGAKEMTQSLDSYDLFDTIGKQVSQKNDANSFLQKIRVIELKNRLPELILMRVDKFTMAASIEARVPFLDYRLVEHAFSIPPYSMHMKNGIYKYVLKQAVKDRLPKEIIMRKKVGFGVPIAEHFRNELKEYVISEFSTPEMAQFLNTTNALGLVERHMSNKADTSFKIWALLNFALWHKYWIRGEKIKI